VSTLGRTVLGFKGLVELDSFVVEGIYPARVSACLLGKARKTYDRLPYAVLLHKNCLVQLFGSPKACIEHDLPPLKRMAGALYVESNVVLPGKVDGLLHVQRLCRIDGKSWIAANMTSFGSSVGIACDTCAVGVNWGAWVACPDGAANAGRITRVECGVEPV
jgi:hypothetical protein